MASRRLPPRTRKDKFRYHPKRETYANRLAFLTCPDCGKQCFKTRHLAKVSAERIFPGQTMRFYECGDFWHFTSVTAGRMAYYREKDHRNAEA